MLRNEHSNDGSSTESLSMVVSSRALRHIAYRRCSTRTNTSASPAISPTMFPITWLSISPLPLKAPLQTVLDRSRYVRALACRLHASTQKAPTASHAPFASDEPRGGELSPSHHVARGAPHLRLRRQISEISHSLPPPSSFVASLKPCVTREMRPDA